MLADLLTLGSRWTLVGGKGGVGKTTTAAALAVALADRGRRVLAMSVDPAHSLGDALGVVLGAEPAAVPGLMRLEAFEVDSDLERRRFVGSRRGALLKLVERGTYLESADVEGFLDLAVPGMDELAAVLRLLELADLPDRQLVVDTAPTGHTLRLLELPTLARGWVAALRAMEQRHRAVSLALTGAYRPDEAAGMLDALDADLAALAALLADPARTRFVLVTNPEAVVLAETRRLGDELERRGIALAGIVVNRAGAAPDGARDERLLFVPRVEPEPRGPDGLRRWAAAAAVAPPAAVPLPVGPAPGEPGAPWRPPADRALYLVAGKGGVGKSTTAAALALLLARDDPTPIRLLSVDPAGSLADVLGFAVGAEATAIPGSPNLTVRQLDAPAAWSRFRDRFQADAERLLGGLLAGGLSASADQAVVRRLIDLAPPGIDELVALLEVTDAAEEEPHARLVLDTAPTGHLLRLLEMPEVAQGWTRSLMRLLLKYREVLPLGALAERLIALSRSLRELADRLHDPATTWTLAVALPEGLSVAETARLLPRLGALGVPAGALLINRAIAADGRPLPAAAAATAQLLALDPALPAAAAPHLAIPPVGAEALLAWAGGWRGLAREFIRG